MRGGQWADARTLSAKVTQLKLCGIYLITFSWLWIAPRVQQRLHQGKHVRQELDL